MLLFPYPGGGGVGVDDLFLHLQMALPLILYPWAICPPLPRDPCHLHLATLFTNYIVLPESLLLKQDNPSNAFTPDTT